MKGFDDRDEELLEEAVIVMIDEDGNEEYYIEEEIIAIGGKRFAILIPVDASGENDDDFDDSGEGAVIAKIIAGEDGEDSYCDPTDEEFEEVLMIYKEREEDGTDD